MIKILYLEDDLNLSETIVEFLEENNFSVTPVYNSDEALDFLYKNSYDILILDVNVPGINGFDLLKYIREANIDTPTIFTTSLSSMDDVNMGYSVGADDYLRKPFALQELFLRINAIVKRQYKTQSNIIKLSDSLSFNISSQELTDDENKIKLNNKESKLLILLLQNKNQCILFDTIYENVWSYDETHSEASLRTYIKKLRQVIGKEKIISIKKQGYKLVF